jgi:hypothetical protein
MDQAGGHGGGKVDLTKTLNILNDSSKGLIPYIEILFIQQPSRSPDFNALDLGLFIVFS